MQAAFSSALIVTTAPNNILNTQNAFHYGSYSHPDGLYSHPDTYKSLYGDSKKEYVV